MLKFLLFTLLFSKLVGAEALENKKSNNEPDLVPLELIEKEDLEKIKDIKIDTEQKAGDIDLSEIEEIDDLESLKQDVGEIIFTDEKKETKKIKENLEEKMEKVENAENYMDDDPPEAKLKKDKVVKKKTPKEEKLKVSLDESQQKIEIFDVGDEEEKLLKQSRFVENKIPNEEWKELSSTKKVEKYEIQEGDYLWKIAKKIFGSGFYYSKIWALNSYIKNPHYVEPGMVLTFDLGDQNRLPEVRLGDFSTGVDQKTGKVSFYFSEFGDASKPEWLDKRSSLIDQGIYFQFSSEETYDDLSKIGKKSLNKEYRNYEPPVERILIEEPGEAYDEVGFDKSSKIVFDFKEGFFLNSFITVNVVQDFGKITDMRDEKLFIGKTDRVYVKLDGGMKIRPGDMFSAYTPEGEVSHKVSERRGHRYTIVGHLRAVKPINDKWEFEVVEVTGLMQRTDRITLYTPKIGRIIKTFNKKNIEAAIIDSYHKSTQGLSFGDVVYIDRGRADGVEMGNVFELYSFLDRGTNKRISKDPTYKIGELTVITITDNFATALISNSSQPITLGAIALSKTMEQAAMSSKIKNKDYLKEVGAQQKKYLEELDIELHLDDMGRDLLDKADKIKLSENELEELERQEREKSVIKEGDKDIKELEKLESQLLEAEMKINEAGLDEDKYLEQQNLNTVEKGSKKLDKDAFEALDEIEKEIGTKFMHDNINAKENPYGLTEFDLEEIDELLNTDSDNNSGKKTKQ